ncbi:MAG: hypothetical protein EA348_09670 [Pseudomonadaceae bacterium]|nr:MAG: hypothetical protein EA348_09670 [Pseudomonadaceae bacterium]
MLKSIVVVVLVMLMVTLAQARVPMQAPDELVAVELATVAVDPFSGAPLVVLREPDSGDFVLISIGTHEAMAIMRALEDVGTPRPMTHDTAVAMLDALDGELHQVMVDALVEGSYLGVLDIRREADPDTPVYVDTRPSDGLALAVRTGARILVAPEVLQASREQDFAGLGDDQVVTALGISVIALNAERREEFSLSSEREGLLVVRARGAAREQGVEAGALIESVNDTPVESVMDFLRQVQATPAGESARLRLWFDGETQDVELDTGVPEAAPGERLQPGQRLI